MQQIGLDATINGVPDFTAGINTMNKAVDSFAKNGQTAGKDFGGGFAEIVTGALRKIGELSVEALLKAGRAVADFTKQSIGLAGDFQANMLEFQSVAGRDVDTKGLEQFRDLFLDIGKRLPVSTSEVQQAAIEMVKGGIDPATVAAGGLEQNIKFASAAMKGDLVKAAEISSKILGGWTAVTATGADKTAFLTHATDLLAKAANASSTDVEGLSRGIFQAQGIAKTAGVSFDDLTTTLAELAPRFASSAEAGTSLKNLISRMQPTTDPAIDAMTRLGLYTEKTGSAFYDAQGNFVGFQQASQLLQESLKGLTKEQQAAALQTIFGNDAMSSASALAELGAKGYANMADALDKANGVQEAAALKQQGFNTALDNAKGSVEALQITIGTALLPVLTDLFNNTIAPAVNTLTDFADAIFSADDPLLALVQSVDALAPGIGSLIGYITTLVSEGDSLNDFLTTTPPLFQDVTAVTRTLASFIGDNLTPILFGVATAITVAVLPALAAAVTAFVSAAAPVAALVAVGALLYKGWTEDWGGIQEKTAAAWAVLQPIFTQVSDWLLTNIPVAAKATVDFFNNDVFPAFSTLADWLKTNIPPAAKATADFWTNTLYPALTKINDYINGTIFPTFKDLADKYLAGVTKSSTDMASSWNSTLYPALTKIAEYTKTSLNFNFSELNVWLATIQKTGELFMAFWNNVLWPGLTKVGDYLSTNLTKFFSDFGAELDRQVGPALEGIVKWFGSLSGGMDGIATQIQNTTKYFNDLAAQIRELKLPDWLTPGSPTPLELGLRGIGDALSKSVSPGLRTMQQGVIDIGAQISESFGNTDIVDSLISLGEDAMAGFSKGLKSGVSGAITYINSTADTIEGAFQDAFGAHSPATLMVPIGEDVTQGIMKGISDMWPALTDLVSGLGDDLIKQAADIAQTVQDAIGDAFGATASIDRQMAKNLDSLSKMSDDFYKTATENALRSAADQAKAFADPTIGAKYYKMRSAQIIEFQDLQKRINEETDADTKASLQQQQILILKAQEAEQSAFDATNSRTKTALDGLAAQLGAIISQIPVNDTGVGHDLMALLRQLEIQSGAYTPPPGALGSTVSPPPGQQYAARTSTTNYTNSTNLSMPIYTNNSPSAIQDSIAIASAALL